ncbi:MAG: potassium transporter [Deltaproteobacteria bacterium]|nr:MAG: potassium transporter [Deltaproteobacteria bacterium]PIE75009.1 MAG: potassium transporter [Deltaproteobacteria bacterium]
MRWGFVFEVCGVLVFFVGVAHILPVLYSLFFSDGALEPLVYSMCLSLITGIGLRFGFRHKTKSAVSPREGMAVVTMGWIAVAFFGAFPFYFSGVIDTFGGAFFESISGFTTTGASVLTNIEASPKSVLLWRSFIQWIGGMGIVLFSIAILPFLGIGGMALYKAEVPSPVPDKLKPRLQETAKLLWWVYSLISILQLIALKLGGMSFFDSLCHTFTTMPTGGFSPKNLSVAHYDSAYIDTIIIIFMVLAGLNFSLHFQFLRGKRLSFFKDPESKFFLAVLLILSLVVTFDLMGSVYDNFLKAFRYASFQVVSIVTTTGFATADYELWPAMSQIIIFFCLFIGASAGSTGGGMKMMRVMISAKYCYKEIFGLIHPRAVRQVKIAGESVEDDIVHSILGFMLLYIGLFVIASVILAAMGVDFTTTLSAVASAIGNVGPGFGSVGPTDNYASIPEAGKWLLSLCMLFGRLEIYTVITLFVPAFWKD